MITCRRVVQIVSAAFVAIAMGACDAGKPSHTADELADDSALAADLALANRDTLLVDSIGAQAPSMAPSADTTLPIANPTSVAAKPNAIKAAVTSPGSLEGASRPQSPGTPAPAPAPTPAPAKPAVTTQPVASVPVAVSNAPKLTGVRACNSPTPENQAECIRVSIAAGDARLNRIYRALITEMRREEGVPGGAKDPPSVQRLRVAQRAWLVYRDTECRRRGRGKEGTLWARPRARCLAQFSGQRANELADNFSRLTAH
jgi:uncharacterized protein YecT (DUF1311 family)